MNKIPIYVINLRRTPERKLYMQRQLDALGLEYQWIEAVDAYDFTNADLEGVNLNKKNQPMAMACLLSHIKFYDQVIKNNHEIACVLEDDAELSPTFLDILNYEKLQKEDWEILLLLHFSMLTQNLLKKYQKLFGTSSSEKQKFSLDYNKYILGAITKNSHKKYTKDHYIAKIIKPSESQTIQPLGTGAYLLRLSAAKELRKIALANQKFILIDDLTGCADSLGFSLKLMTPPCARSNPKYIEYSSIVQYKEIEITTNKFPHQKILQLYIRNKWIVLAPFTFNGKLGIKLRMFLLNNLKQICILKIRGYLTPRKVYNSRIRRIKKN